MRCARRGLLLAVAFLVPLSAAAQSPPSAGPRRDPQAANVAAASMAAMEGNLAAIRDTEILAQVSRGETQPASSVTVRTLGNTLYKVEGTSAEVTSTFAVGADRAVSKIGSNPSEFIPRRAVAEGGITQVPFLSLLSRWQETGMNLEYVGLEKIDQQAVHHIRLTPQLTEGLPKRLESPCDFYIDSSSFLVVKMVYVVRPPENLLVSVPVEVSYSDYRAVAGALFPFKITYTSRGNLLREYQVTSLAVNRGFQASDFEVR